ncbi:MAG: hypothetical protein U0Q55_12330 [Vicinamibacterales bacterium]
MFRTLLKSATIAVNQVEFPVRFYELHTARRLRRYSVEVHLDSQDHIILDDDSVLKLEWKLERMAPAMVSSRRLCSEG